MCGIIILVMYIMSGHLGGDPFVSCRSQPPKGTYIMAIHWLLLQSAPLLPPFALNCDICENRHQRGVKSTLCCTGKLHTRGWWCVYNAHNIVYIGKGSLSYIEGISIGQNNCVVERRGCVPPYTRSTAHPYNIQPVLILNSLGFPRARGIHR